MQGNMSLVLTNAANPAPANPPIYSYAYTNTLAFLPGSGWNYATLPPSASSVNPASFITNQWTLAFLPPSAYMSQSGDFIPLTTFPPPSSYWETGVTYNYPFPQFGLSATNWVQAFVLDGLPGSQHIIDYVQFSGPNFIRKINAQLNDPNYPDATGIDYMWSTNGYDNNSSGVPAWGVVNQIFVSQGLAGETAPPGGTWSTIPVAGGYTNSAAQQAFFDGFWTPTWSYGGNIYSNTNLSVVAPYTPRGQCMITPSGRPMIP